MQLTRTVLRPSCICLGVSHIGVRNTETEAHELLNLFAGKGGTFIDTARVYSDWVPGELHRSERILGDWLKASGMRERMVIATKGGHPPLNDMKRSRLSSAEVRADLEGSLRSLRTDRIDIYYLHRDDPTIPVQSIIDMLDRFVSDGKIRYYGCSNWKPDRIDEAMTYARTKGTTGFVCNQVLWNAGCWTMAPLPDPTLVVFDRSTRDLHRRIPITAVAYSSQAGGFFSKLDGLGGRPDENLRRNPYCSAINLRAYGVMKDVAGREGLTMCEVVLLYLLQQPVPVIPIVGCHDAPMLNQSLSAADRGIDKDDLGRIEDAVMAASR